MRSCDDRAMMTRQLQLDVLSAPLPAIGRRVLSQAWYSALGLSAKASAGAPQDCECGRVQHEETFAAARTGARERMRASSPLGLVRPQEPKPKPAAAECATLERRGPRSPLARRIEGAFLDPRASARRTTFAVGGKAARVHVLLQGSGDRVRIVAFCPRNMRETVARALAQARFALASRGVSLDVPEQGVRACT
jgi:hypothetical protein